MPKKKINNIILPYIPEHLKVTEKISSEIEQNIKKFPKELGEEHPFDFKVCDDAYKNSGLIKAAVDKHVDFIISPGFYVESEKDKAAELINNFIDETNFVKTLREFIYPYLNKGTSFMEIASDKKGVKTKIVNSNSCYIVRDINGNIKGYNQYTGDLSKLSIRKVIPFDNTEMIHISMNPIGDCPYGVGMVYPALYTINNLIRAEKDSHMLIGRKANSPIHAKLGSYEEPATAADVTAFGQQLIYLNNLHEWATDHKVDFKVIDFGNIGDKFTSVLEHDMEMLFYIFQVPPVLMGMANVPEGLAKAQKDAFERRIQSIQADLGSVISNGIFKRILNLNGLDAKVKLIWGEPSDDAVNEKVGRLTLLLNNPLISPQLRAMVEIDIANTLGYEGDVQTLTVPKEAKAEKDAEMSLIQPEIPTEKPNAKEIFKESYVYEKDLTLFEYANLKEFGGFNYKDYLDAVLKRTDIDKFEDLRAESEKDIEDGLLSQSEIEKLREIFKKGFSDKQTLIQIENNIKKMNLPDRKTDNQTIPGEDRPNMIARTETVRLTNMGLIDMYKEKGIEKVRWLSSISERTCPICDNLNGQLFEIGSVDAPPKHVNCRCALVGVTE
jgi:SPP1 gp7 family putative phage head morphogenesis protein